MTGGLLVAHVDDANALVEAAVVDGLDVTAAERKQVRHAMSFERLGDEAPAVNECHAGELSSFFARSLLALAVAACGASGPPATQICTRVTQPQGLAAPSLDATIEREVATSRTTYVFRASRTANLVYALDCLAARSRCSFEAYESELALDDSDRESIRAWREVHHHLEGTIRPSEETSDPADLPIPGPSARSVAAHLRVAAYGADDVPGVLDCMSILLEPTDVARARSVIARFEPRLEKLWLARRASLASAADGFASLMSRPDVVAIVDSVARFYEPDLPPGARATFELLARPEHEGADYGEQLGDYALVEMVSKERPEERLDVVLHELFHRWFASAPYAKKRTLANAFATSSDPFGRAAYGLLNESLATSFGNGFVARAVNRPDFEKRLAKPLGLYHDRFIDPTVKAILDWLDRWIADNKTLYDPRFVDEYVAKVSSAFPKGVAPVLQLRPLVSAYEESLEDTEHHFYDAVSAGWTESENGFNAEARDLLARHPRWGTAIVVTSDHVDRVKGLDKTVDAAMDGGP